MSDESYTCTFCRTVWPRKESAQACCRNLSDLDAQLIKVLDEVRKAVEMADRMAIHPKFKAAGTIYSAMAKLTEDARVWADDALLSYVEAKQPDRERWDDDWSLQHDATWHDGVQHRVWHGNWKDKRSGSPPKPWPNNRSYQAALKRAQQLRQRYGKEAIEAWEKDWCSQQTTEDYHVAQYGGWWAVFSGPFTGMAPMTDEPRACDRRMRQPVPFPDNPEEHSHGRAVFHRHADARQYMEELRRGDRALPEATS